MTVRPTKEHSGICTYFY